MTFQWWFIVNLAASNLLLPLLIHQQSFGHPCSCLRHLSATHSLVTNHLVDRSQVLRELYVIFWDRRVIQINLKIWSALVWCGTIKNVYWGYLCWAATEAVWERLNRGDMKALLRLIFKTCFCVTEYQEAQRYLQNAIVWLQWPGEHRVGLRHLGIQFLKNINGS